MIELYIENKKIDLADDIDISFTYEPIDPSKLASIKNSFSKTVNIPGTASNNITFGHIFRYDKYIPISGATSIDNNYDPHKRVNWFINKNGSMINSGYCTLDNILIKSERDITYQLTLYGGIGEFFYSLSYNEDGSPKTLADMYWNWFPKVGLIGHVTQTTPTDENSRTLYKCSADIVASSYHNLNPLYTYEGTTEIEKDVVFIPCYTGLYNDFDSKHMLVSTFNQNYASNAQQYLPATTKSSLEASFPDTIVEDGKTYTTIGKTLSSLEAYRYGLVTFSRDLDPWEAGDLRINELPVAIRLSKLMNVISQPENNGGYEVEWDDEIKSSFHWLYSWVMLGKIKQDNNELNLLVLSPNDDYDGQFTTINVDWHTGDATTTDDATPYFLSRNVGSVQKGNYTLYLNVKPRLTFRCNSFNYYVSRYPNYMSGSMHDNGRQGSQAHFRYVYTTPVIIHKIYDGNTLLKAIADVFWFSTSPMTYNFGYNANRANLNDIREVLNGKINASFMEQSEFISQFNYHSCKLENPQVTSNQLIDEVTFDCLNERIMVSIDLDSDATDFKVEQLQGIMWTNLSDTTAITSGLYGTDNISFTVISDPQDTSPGGYRPSVEAPYGFITSSAHSLWHYNEFSLQANQNNSSVRFNLNESKQNGLMDAKNSGFNIVNLDKKTLFAMSKSPMEYISGFCKLMNYKFVCDNTSRKIHISTLRNYYDSSKVIGIDERVDIGRDISIKNITTTYKTLNIGLESTSTYPIYLFNKTSKDKFNIKKYDTGLKYNAPESSLLDDLVFKDTLEWQQSSIFYNIYPQFPRAYSTQSISWTLFDTSGNETNKIEIFTPGSPSTELSLLANIDFLPKIALFDKDDKAVDFESTLMFLNGFVKNYDYTQVGSDYVISPRVSFSNDMYEQYYLNQARCYVYDFKYNDNFTSWGCYSTDQRGTASSWILPMFSRDLYNAYIPDIQAWNATTYKLASWNFTNQEGLGTQYKLVDTDFIYDTNYNYTKTSTSTTWLSNEYKTNEIPEDNKEYTERIYDKNWKDYLDDLYDRNTRDVTMYVDLSGLGDANSIMRNIYSYKSHLWIIIKLFDFKISETTRDKFTKVTMHKIRDLSTWTS